MININKRIYCEKILVTKFRKRWNFIKRFLNFVANIFAVRANSKFQFVGAAVSKIHSKAVTIKQMNK